MGATFHIFTTAGGQARYVETVENLAAARNRLKQVAHNASGDCFFLLNPKRHCGTHCPPRDSEALAKSPHASHCSGARRELAQQEGMYEPRGIQNVTRAE
jgi:hypothetical protein